MSSPRTQCSSPRCLALLLPLFTAISPVVSHAQSVQAVRTIGEASASESQASRDSVLIKAAKLVIAYELIYETSKDVADKDQRRARDHVWTLLVAVRRVLDERDDEEAFVKAIKEYNVLEEQLFGRDVVVGWSALNANRSGPVEIKGLPVPQAHLIVPGIVFTVGPELQAGDGFTVGAFGLSTNLLGEAVGTVFDALGSAALKDYFSKNISAGTAIPVGGDYKLSAQIGLGLGGINFKKATIWPILNIEQVDSEDKRLPSSLLEGSDETNWSSPILSIAVVPYTREGIRKRMSEGKLVFIPVAGVRLPYYYPGDPFSSLAALFTNSRANYEKAGEASLILGVSIPLLKVSD